ncbi:MAG: NifB/NifX family molybdenum-iron cluster-binding protein [candidate division Zixibacteria bacterium]|nr:NifB/NifX family molybdenum-iron cluster-binding protein [candidate division Zixibacteria bacterium]
MKIAVPTSDGLLSPHFGRCQEFTILEVESSGGEIVAVEHANPPAHQPGAFPQWLSQLGVSLVIAGGMGVRAIQMFEASGIKVISGAAALPPEELAKAYLEGEMSSEENPCDHDSSQPCQGHEGSPRRRGCR